MQFTPWVERTILSCCHRCDSRLPSAVFGGDAAGRPAKVSTTRLKKVRRSSRQAHFGFQALQSGWRRCRAPAFDAAAAPGVVKRRPPRPVWSPCRERSRRWAAR